MNWSHGVERFALSECILFLKDLKEDKPHFQCKRKRKYLSSLESNYKDSFCARANIVYNHINLTPIGTPLELEIYMSHFSQEKVYCVSG